jgi:hypothetical protein
LYLGSVIAMTGHKDLKLAAHYSKLDGEVQKETSMKIVEHIRSLGLHDESRFEAVNVIPLKRLKAVPR